MRYLDAARPALQEQETARYAAEVAAAAAAGEPIPGQNNIQTGVRQLSLAVR
jgi:hypothetical protein